MEQPHHHPTANSQILLQIGIALTLVVFFLELVGGFWTHSLALLSDAWHVFIDLWTLVLSFVAIALAKRPVTDRRTFGWHRMEVLAALANGLTVFAVAIGILIAAYSRATHPSPIDGPGVIGFGVIGLSLNMVVAWLFHGSAHTDLNIRSAYLHVIGDALNSVAVVVAGVLIWLTGKTWIDPAVSLLIAGIILWNGGGLLVEAVNTLLEGAPRDIPVAAVETEIRHVPGVVSVHDLHIWSICSHLRTLSGHVRIDARQMAEQRQLLGQINTLLSGRFGIHHTTLQVESEEWPPDQSHLETGHHDEHLEHTA